MSCYNNKMFASFDETRSAGKYGIPTLEPVHIIPDKMLGFNHARTSKAYDSCIHFFLDDYQFERCWNRPEENIKILSKFKCCLTPDFSLYRDMPLAMMVFNVYRSRMFGQMCQDAGLTVIPTIQFAGEETYDFAFDGLPKNSTVAISTVGCCSDSIATDLFRQGYDEMIRRINPKVVLFYGRELLLAVDNLRTEKIVTFDSFSQTRFERK